MTIQTVHLDVSQVRHDVFCPSCGAHLLVHGADFGSCKHLLFSWESISSEYYDPKGGLARLAESWDREHQELEESLLNLAPTHPELLELLPPSTILLHLEGESTGCGMTCQEVVLAIDPRAS